MGAKLGVEEFDLLFQGDLNMILLKSICKPFSICSLTRALCRLVPEARRVYPQSTDPRESLQTTEKPGIQPAIQAVARKLLPTGLCRSNFRAHISRTGNLSHHVVICNANVY